jgi:signal transduction histidine kinase
MDALRVEPSLRAGALFLTLGAVLVGVYFALPTGGAAQDVVYDGLGVAAAALTLWAVRRHRPATALPWLLLALGTLASVAGDVAFGLEPNAVSPALFDVFYLASYPLLTAALAILVARAGGRYRVAAVAEAGIAGIAFALFQWVFLSHPVLRGAGGLGERVVDASYPAGDVILLAGCVGFCVSPAWRKPSFWLLIGALVSMVAADEVYGFTASSYTSGDAVDAGWMLAYVLLGAAALHPSMRDLEMPRRRATLHVGAWRIGLLTCAALSPAAILLVQYARGAPLEIPAVFTGAVLISSLVVWRLTGILRALEQLGLRERAARAEADSARRLLLEQNERLLEADRLKDEFVALISHDLRTPLTSIVGFTELALEAPDSPPLDDERQSYLEVISRSSERLLHLVDDLLFVARLQAGRGLDLELTELDLALVARQSVHEAQPRARGKGLELRCGGAESASVVGDRGRLFQLLDNLIANAIKFTPSGGTIDVSVEQAPDAVVVEVRDTGIGLAPEDAERLFDRFYRSSRAVTEQIPGTGLGLFIARAITEAHGGRISARGNEGGGATLRIELPVRAPLPVARLVA